MQEESLQGEWLEKAKKELNETEDNKLKGLQVMREMISSKYLFSSFLKQSFTHFSYFFLNLCAVEVCCIRSK